MDTTTRTHAFVGLLFAAVLGSGFVLELCGVLTSDARSPFEAFSWAAFWTGDDARMLEEHLEDRSVLAGTVRPVYHEYVFAISGSPSRKVMVGDDFLFARDRVEPHTEAFWKGQWREVAEAMRPLARRLEAWGCRILVMAVPDTIRVYPEKLPVYEGSAKEPAYGWLLESLSGAGLAVVDLEKGLLESRRRHGDAQLLFQRDDHHWTEHGSRVACQITAGRIRELLDVGKQGLGLTTRLYEYTERGSFNRLAGWPADSDAERRFADGTNKFTVHLPDGSPYLETMDVDVVMTGDSFGEFSTAALVAWALDHRVGGISTAGKGASYPMYELLQLLDAGIRPSLVIWLFEEHAAYQEATPWKDLLLAPTFPDPRPGLHERRFSLDRVRPGEAASSQREGQELVVTNRLTWFDLTVPRGEVEGAHLVFYVQPSLVDLKRSYLALDDAGTAPETRAAAGGRRIMLLDSYAGRWQRVCLPVPPGSGDLVITCRRAEIGGTVRFRDFAALSETAGERAPPLQGWRPRTYRIGAAGIWGQFQLPGPPAPVAAIPLDGKTAPFAATGSSARILLDPPLPGGGRLEVVLGLEAGASPASGPVVFNFKLRTGDRDRTVFLKEVSVTAGQSLRIPVTLDIEDPLPPDTRLLVEIRAAFSLQGRVGMGVAFPD